MSAVLSDTPLPVRFKLTVEQYYRMAEFGILREDERVELLDGELIAMAPIGSLHAGLVSRLNRLLVSDPTLRYDRDVKQRFYADAGVREFWVADVHARQILVYRDPAALQYRSAQTLTAGDAAVCQALPQISIGVGELFAGID